MSKEESRPSSVFESIGNASRHAEKLREANEKLREVMESLATEKRRKEGGTNPGVSPIVPNAGLQDVDVARIRQQLSDIEHENRRILDKLAALDEYTAHLANLYAASCRLNESLNRSEIMASAEDVLINFVGADKFAIFELSKDGRTLVSTHRSAGLEAGKDDKVDAGKGPIGGVVTQGKPRLGTGQPGDPVIAIPLKLGESVRGAIAVYALLPHKVSLTPMDQEVLGLFTAQLARSLHCADLEHPR